MDIIYELANYLQDAGFGTINTDIFGDTIPAETDGLYLLYNAGENNNYLPLETIMVDIYCKDHSPQTCKTTLRNIKNHIHRMHNTTTTNGYIYSMLVLGDIEPIERDAQFASIYKITVSVLCRDNNLIS